MQLLPIRSAIFATIVYHKIVLQCTGERGKTRVNVESFRDRLMIMVHLDRLDIGLQAIQRALERFLSGELNI